MSRKPVSLPYLLRYEIADRLRAHPWPYLPLVRWWRRDAEGRPKAVTRDTRLVLEGYPRSGNTFARIAFETSQPSPVRLAHHLHAPAQVLAAARYGIPCLVLIREPDEAVLSQVVREPRLSLGQTLRSYARFHEAILPVRASFVLARFETVTGDFGRAIEAVNRKFGTGFATAADTDADAESERIRARVDRHDAALGKPEHRRGRPTAVRDAAKDSLRERLDSPALREARERARNVYRLLVESADV